MKADDPIRRLQDWFDTAEPRRAPAEMLDAVFGVTRSSRQRRWFTWRGQPIEGRMGGMAWSLAGIGGAIVLLAAVGLALYAGPGPGVGASPIPSPNAFTSDRHKYTLLLPEGWTVEEKPGEWLPGAVFSVNGPGYDQTVPPPGTTGGYYAPWLSTQLIPEGQTFEEWRIDYDTRTARAFPNCPRQGDFETVVVDREPARLGTYMCGPEPSLEVVWSHVGRAFVFRLGGPEGARYPDTRAHLDDWLARFHHTEEASGQ